MTSDWKSNYDKRKEQIYKDLLFCQDLMNRLIAQAKKTKDNDTVWNDGHTVVQNDIIRLRRELNNVRIKCNPYYEEDGD